MDEVTNKIIIEKILAFIGLSFIIAFYPPFSWLFFSVSLGTSAIAIIAGIYGNLKRNKELTLAHHLGVAAVMALMSLRFFDISTGLSWSLIRWLFLGVLPIAILPFANKKLSEVLYREQVAPQTKIGRIIFTISLGLAPFIGVIGASFGLRAGRYGNSITFIVAGFLMYLVTLGSVFFSFHRYATDQFRWITRKK